MYEKYQEALASGVSNKERQKIITNLAFKKDVGPADMKDFMDLIKEKKDLSKEKTYLNWFGYINLIKPRLTYLPKYTELQINFLIS